MAKPNKAARGKHRWIGLAVLGGVTSRSEVESRLVEALGSVQFRLFDCKSGESGDTLAIVKVALEDYDSAREKLDVTEAFQARTSSGKIRLVRERLSLPRPVRKR